MNLRERHPPVLPLFPRSLWHATVSYYSSGAVCIWPQLGIILPQIRPWTWPRLLTLGVKIADDS